MNKIHRLYKQVEYHEIFSGALLSWSIVIGYFLRFCNHLNALYGFFSIILALVLMPFVTLIIHFALKYLFYLNAIKDNKQYLSDKKFFFLVMIFLMVCWSPYFLAYYPGIFAYDVGNQMQQITTGEYHTKHPLLHTFLMQIFYNLGGKLHSYNLGIAFYSLFQMAVLAAIISYTIMVIRRLNTGKIIRYVILCYYALFPVHAMLSISVTKDVIFSGFVLLFSVLYYKEIVKNQNATYGISFLILVIVAVVTCLFRNNAIYAFFLSGILGILYVIKDKKKRQYLILFYTVSVIFYFIVNAFLIRVTDAHVGSMREALSVPFQQISCTYRMHLEQLSEEERNEIEELIPNVSEYNPILADPVKSSAKVRGNEKRIMRIWAKLLVKHPITYIEAFLYNSYGNWFIDDISNAYVYGNPGETRRGYLISFCITENGVEHISYLPSWEKICERLFSYNDYQKIPVLRIIFAPALYFWIIFILLTEALFKKQKTILISGVFLIAYHFTIMFGPCCLVRYMYPLMITMPFIVATYLHEKEKGKGI